MTTTVIFYVDESGDFGWNFTAPFRSGGSSRYLTIASLACPDNKRHLPKRLIRNLYNRFGWNPKEEKKWSRMTSRERERFATDACSLVDKHRDIKLFSISVAKENVTGHMRKDSNKLYNYMIRLLLAEEMARHERVELVPDARSIKVESGNSLHDYLWIYLTYEKRVETDLKTLPSDSARTKNLQFADMLAGVVQHHYEDSNSACWNILQPYVDSKRLFF